MEPSTRAFQESIHRAFPGLREDSALAAARFAVILHRENEKQNLTRILGAEEFPEGHLLDVLELMKVPDLGQRVLDVGSGSGVPGLLASAVSQGDAREWALVESEKGKAEYLGSAATELGLNRTSVHHARVEDVVADLAPDTVIARAVGTVDRIAAWIWNCSTWNTLILFKSRGWEKEWEAARLTKFGRKLTISHTHDYSANGKTRLLVSLKRK
ncbi:MAG: class I SAM-dependent methyltransferase [Bdellovibrionales bacterium]|nr:class I SAM-dependent methyltransferase [Bdellovibrionales bacterium]